VIEKALRLAPMPDDFGWAMAGMQGSYGTSCAP
jgi:hypothetical protein